MIGGNEAMGENGPASTRFFLEMDASAGECSLWSS
jgi:hypothetical protein